MAAEPKVTFPGLFHAANESEGEERGDVPFEVGFDEVRSNLKVPFATSSWSGTDNVAL